MAFINIVTKHSSATVGTLLEGAAGSELRHMAAFSQGGQSQNATWRVSGRRIEEDGGQLASGADEAGSWQSNHVGFRIDRSVEFFDTHTFSGGLTTSGFDSPAIRPLPSPPMFATPVDESNNYLNWYLSSRRSVELEENGSFEVQSYIDVMENDIPTYLKSRTLVADFGFQHNLVAGEGHNVVWGSNYRLNMLQLSRGSFQLTAPRETHYSIYSMFMQDTIDLADEVALTLGIKLSWNDITQFEYQPTARFVWNPTPKHSVWTSVSRAVRIPTFAQTQASFRTPPVTLVPLPTFAHIVGNPSVNAENLLAFEGGIRGQPSRDFYWDLSAYYFHSTDSIVPTPTGTTNVTFPPGYADAVLTYLNIPGTSDTGGFEFLTRYSVTEHWNLSGNYSFAVVDAIDGLARYPRNSLYIQSSHDLTEQTAA